MVNNPVDRRVFDQAGDAHEFLTRQRFSEFMAQALLGLEELRKNQVIALIEWMRSFDVAALINEGKLTVGMIRPRAEHNLHNLDDLTAAEEIQKAIRPPLEAGITFSVLFDKAAVEDFYQGGPKERQLGVPAYYPDKGFPTRWEEFIDLMTSGPATVTLLYDEGGAAIEAWRKQVGHWNIEVTPRPDTIRGLYGLNNYNNLLHGSDSKEAAVREMALLADLLERSLNDSND